MTWLDFERLAHTVDEIVRQQRKAGKAGRG